MRLYKQNTRLQAPDVHGVEHITKKSENYKTRNATELYVNSR